MGPFVFEFSTIAAGTEIGPDECAATLDAFLRRLPRGAEYAIEVRNTEFLTPAYFAVPRRYGVAHTFSGWTHMPSIGAQLDLAGSVTAPFTVVRALARPGRTYDEAIDFFKLFDSIHEPSMEVRDDLLRLIELGWTGQRLYVLVGIGSKDRRREPSWPSRNSRRGAATSQGDTRLNAPWVRICYYLEVRIIHGSRKTINRERIRTDNEKLNAFRDERGQHVSEVGIQHAPALPGKSKHPAPTATSSRAAPPGVAPRHYHGPHRRANA